MKWLGCGLISRLNRTTVLVSATGYYHIFAIPYVASYSFFNKDTRFEIYVDDVELFSEKYKDGISKLKDFHGMDIIKIKKIDTTILGDNFQQATPRFVQQPDVKTEFIYIGDVDVLILDSMITDQHIHNMKMNGLPFSNVLRNDEGNSFSQVGPRLSGLHFTEWDAYYPLPEKLTKQNEASSEHLLFEIVKSKIGNFEIKHSFRPIHGFHISDKLHTWDPQSTQQIGLHTEYLTNYFSLRKSDYWNEMKSYFDEVFQSWLDIIDSSIDLLWPDNNGISVPRPYFRNGSFIGPGLVDSQSVSDVTNSRHQFLDVLSQKSEFTEAGEIFDFINFLRDSGRSRLTLMGSEFFQNFSTINRVFHKIVVIRPPNEEEQQQHPVYRNLSKLIDLALVNWEPPVSGEDWITIISPQAYHYMEGSEFDWSIFGDKDCIGLISSDSDDEICELSGCLTNTRVFSEATCEKSYCINRKFENGNEIRYYLDIYPEGVFPIPDNRGKKLLEEIKELEDQGDMEGFAQIYETNKSRFGLNRQRVNRYVRHLYQSERYLDCISEVDVYSSKIPSLMKMKARSMRNIGDVDGAIENYGLHLEIYPSDTDCLIEMLELFIVKGEDIEEVTSQYADITNNRKQFEDWMGKHG